MVVEGGGDGASGASGTTDSGGAAAGGGAAGSSAGSGADGGASAGKAAGDGAGAAAGGEKGAAGAAGGQAAYTPNYKYKVLKEEKEIPEHFRALVKDAATEKQVRELFEKSDGLPAVTQHRDQLIQENKVMREQWGPFVQDAQTALNAARKGDLDTFFEKVGLTEEQVLRYALKRLQLREKPELLEAHNRDRTFNQQLEDLRQENARLQQGLAETSTQSRARDLDMQLARTEIQAVVQAFNARAGNPQAFRNAVIERGQWHWSQGRDVPADQAVNEVLNFVGFTPGTGVVAGGAGAAGGDGGGTPEPKPTLPNIRGKGTAPVKKVPRSTEELRQLAREKQFGA